MTTQPFPAARPEHSAHRAHTTQTAHTRARPSRRTLVARFAFHYLEMVLAMVAGMVVFGGLIAVLASAAGLDYSHETYPVTGAVEMALTMSLGMALWMRVRRHRRRHVAEMTAAMVAPLAVLLPLVWTGVLAAGSLMMLEHVLMFPLMLLVMLLSPSAYTGHHHSDEH
jgi:flagellar biosynthetic protein FliP